MSDVNEKSQIYRSGPRGTYNVFLMALGTLQRGEGRALMRASVYDATGGHLVLSSLPDKATHVFLGFEASPMVTPTSSDPTFEGKGNGSSTNEETGTSWRLGGGGGLTVCEKCAVNVKKELTSELPAKTQI